MCGVLLTREDREGVAIGEAKKKPNEIRLTKERLFYKVLAREVSQKVFRNVTSLRSYGANIHVPFLNTNGMNHFFTRKPLCGGGG